MTEILLLAIVALSMLVDVNILLYFRRKLRKEVLNERS